MQPRTLVLIITILPLLASHAVYLLSAYEGLLPWCIPYIDGCTNISRAARSGNSIFIYRASMIAYSVLLIWFWVYVYQWLKLLYGHVTKTSRVILLLGVVGAIFLIVYIDFLGTTGEVNRFMRRHGIMVFFTFTPLAQLLMLQQHYNILPTMTGGTIKPGALRYQLIILLLMMVIAIISAAVDITHTKTDVSENIVEWNFSFLMNMYFLGTFFIWKNYQYYLLNNSSRE
jgi:hypothetical protein